MSGTCKLIILLFATSCLCLPARGGEPERPGDPLGSMPLIQKPIIEYSWYFGYKANPSQNVCYGTQALLDSWTPLHLVIVNNEKKPNQLFEGTLKCLVRDRRGRNTYETAYETPVALAGGGSKKHIMLYVFLPESLASGYGSVQVRLESATHRMGTLPQPELNFTRRLEQYPGQWDKYLLTSQVLLLSNSDLALPPAAPKDKFTREYRIVQGEVDSLPRRGRGYAGLCALFWDGLPLDKLEEDQKQAVRDYVASGGMLVIFVGSNLLALQKNFLDELLPCSVEPGEDRDLGATLFGLNGRNKVTAARLQPLVGARVTRRDFDGAAMVVERDYGAGRVKAVAFSATADLFRFRSLSSANPGEDSESGEAVKEAKRLWRDKWIGRLSAPENSLSESLLDQGLRLSAAEHFRRTATKKIPSRGAIFAFLAIYLLVLVPLNYVVFRGWKRPELAWLLTPALAALFFAGIYLVAFRNAEKNLSITDLFALRMGPDGACGVFAVSLMFNPSYERYDFRLDSARLLPAYLRSGDVENLQGDRAEHDLRDSGDGGLEYRRQQIRVNSFRLFETTGSLQLGQGLTVRLNEETASGERRADGTAGTADNRTDETLREPFLLRGKEMLPLRDLPPGMALPLQAADGEGFRKASENEFGALALRVGAERENLAAFLRLAAQALAGHDNRLYLCGFFKKTFLPWEVGGKKADPVGLTFFVRPCEGGEAPPVELPLPRPSAGDGEDSGVYFESADLDDL